MPISWQEHWPLLDEEGQPVGYDNPLYWKRQTAIHTLGNLTIVTEGLNRSLKNLPFEDKKAQLVEHSNLTLNRRVAEHAGWSEISIRQRSELLATLACSIWPSPTSST